MGPASLPVLNTQALKGSIFHSPGCLVSFWRQTYRLPEYTGGSLVSLLEDWDCVKKWVKLYIPLYLGKDITVATVKGLD